MKNTGYASLFNAPYAPSTAINPPETDYDNFIIWIEKKGLEDLVEACENIEKTKADGEIVYLCQKILDTLANQWRGLNGIHG